MRFKSELVWVRADDSGRPLLDGAGRAEMKYRESDEKTYKPSPANLTPDASGAGASLPAAPARRASGRGSAATGAAPRSSPRASPLKAAGAIEVWTDGACSGNPGPMGIGVVVVDGAERQELSEYLGVGTNNIAELVAIERGLEVTAARTKTDRQRHVRVYSDSGYAIGLLEKGWKAKANQELVARLRQQVAAVANLEFVKVRGHAGVPENERCDELARAAITRGR
ncbi:MAG TPA: ribonuclease H [Polyangia bacterium]|nr:ribonuclease H [Polyangia bacterium]